MNLLYQRIGGHEGISKLLRHFYAARSGGTIAADLFLVTVSESA
jgi:truncated hemoglobin YjbI